MKYLTHEQFRKKWFDFWKERKHLFLPSASLISRDQSLILINSGIAALRDFFFNPETAPSKRIVNIQKVVRTNDLESVGKTLRHLSFFEMMGNFSLGGYFKKEAILWAWEFLTDPEQLGLDKKKIYVVYFKKDDRTLEILSKDLRIEKERIIAGGKDTNFWDLGVGPCGPNLEFFYDIGQKHDPKNIGVDLLRKNIENDRFLEIWNIVFSELINLGNDKYIEQKTKNIDTGAGLERLLMILQKKNNCFETDLFASVLKKIELLTDKKYTFSSNQLTLVEKKINTSFKVIMDHLRTITFLLADLLDEGVDWSFQTKQGYIVRKILRSCLLKVLFFKKKFSISELVDPLISTMKKTFANLENHSKKIKDIIREEEEKFFLILKNPFFKKILWNEQSKKIEGQEIFELTTTHGLPLDFLKQIAKSKKKELNLKEFELLWKEHQKKSRSLSRSFTKDWKVFQPLNSVSSLFIEDENELKNSEIKEIFFQNERVKKIRNKKVWLLLDKTIFFAEAGGQDFDLGTIQGKSATGKVINVQKNKDSQFFHLVDIQGEIKEGEKIFLNLDAKKRRLTRKNHSATHLLQAALRNKLGNLFFQVGSFNNDEYLRIDFRGNIENNVSLFEQLELKIKELIEKKISCSISWTTLEKAKKLNALAFFEETYDKKNVRIVSFADYSIELCGGTHVKNTEEIEHFSIIKFEKIGKNVFRIYGKTSFNARKEMNNTFLNEFMFWKKKIDENLFKESPELLEKTSFLEKKIQKFDFSWLKCKKIFDDLKRYKKEIEKKYKKRIFLEKINNFVFSEKYSRENLLFQNISQEDSSLLFVLFPLFKKAEKKNFDLIFLFGELNRDKYKFIFLDKSKKIKNLNIFFKKIDKNIEILNKESLIDGFCSQLFIEKIEKKLLDLAKKQVS